MLAGNQANATPEFLSTHPDPGNRVEAINAKARQEGCKTAPADNGTFYQQFKNSLN
jgi:beta-barrel assembly-enhancing protease